MVRFCGRYFLSVQEDVTGVWAETTETHGEARRSVVLDFLEVEPAGKFHRSSLFFPFIANQAAVTEDNSVLETVSNWKAVVVAGATRLL